MINDCKLQKVIKNENLTKPTDMNDGDTKLQNYKIWSKFSNPEPRENGDARLRQPPRRDLVLSSYC